MHEIEEFRLLTKTGVIGCYNSCEITEIFGFREGKPYNIYTLLTFEDSGRGEQKAKFLTEKLMKIPGGKNGKYGIRASRVMISDAERILEKLLAGRLILEGESESRTGSLAVQPKKYVPSGDTAAVNHVLKNNFYAGSYIMEAFDCTKENVGFLLEKPEILNALSEEIYQILPIQLAAVSDRLGNVIFQFPINLFSVKIGRAEPEGLLVQLQYNQACSADGQELSCVAINHHDHCVNDISRLVLKDQGEFIMPIKVIDETEVILMKEEYQLTLYHEKVSFANRFCLDMNIVNPQKRVFRQDAKSVRLEVGEIIKERMWENPYKIKPLDWIENRIYEQQRSSLEKSGKFRQFFAGERQKAVDFVREIIKKHSSDGVYLWDPYASAEDIKEILYYVPYCNVPLRVITALDNLNNNGTRKQIEAIRTKLLEDDLDYLLMHLEVRACCFGYGWGFHDRFLIFPSQKPHVWSLGISVNELGGSHHIIQEIQNAQHILNAFEELWRELDRKECEIWKI